MTIETKRHLIFNERVHSLIKDGYTYVLISVGLTNAFIKLRHHTNGTIISLNGDFSKNTLVQKRNGIIVHIGKLTND